MYIVYCIKNPNIIRQRTQTKPLDQDETLDHGGMHKLCVFNGVGVR